MGVLVVGRLWIDPANVAVGAAVNQIDAPVSSVTEYDDWTTREVEFHHRLADRKLPQRRRGLGNDDRVELGHLLVGVLLGGGDDVAAGIRGHGIRRMAVAPPRSMPLKPPLVSP